MIQIHESCKIRGKRYRSAETYHKEASKVIETQKEHKPSRDISFSLLTIEVSIVHMTAMDEGTSI